MSKSNAAARPIEPFAVFRKLVSPEDIIEAACRLGAMQRQRKVEMPALVEATIAAVLPTQGAQTTAYANYISLTGQRLAPSAFYDRFSDEFAELMREVAMRGVAAVRELAPSDRRFSDFGVLLEQFSDVQVVDATQHIVRRLAPDAGRKSRPGIKWHSLISLKDGLPVAEEITSRYVADVRALPDGALQSGTLTLMDLGYTDYGLFIDAIERDAHFLSRLKENGNPVIVKVHIGEGEHKKLRGMRLNEVVRGRRGQDPAGFLGLDRGVIDLDVRLEKGERSAIARAVAVNGPEGELRWYLTNVERDVLSPKDIANAYRLRWSVELFFKQLKSGAGLNAVLSGRRSAVTALLYAKLIAVCLARLLELSLEKKNGRNATTQLALVIALTRCAPLLLSMMMSARGVTLKQLEERIMIIAETTARSRSQRRERTRRRREKSLGRG